MTVELRDLRWAIVASQHRSLRQAAASLNIRQSTLSRKLRDMEGRVGTQLFERTNGGTRPTIAGREFLASAHHILAEADVALRRLRTRSRGENGQLACCLCGASAPSLGFTLVIICQKNTLYAGQTLLGNRSRSRNLGQAQNSIAS